jgi:hypothetical protein
MTLDYVMLAPADCRNNSLQYRLMDYSLHSDNYPTFEQLLISCVYDYSIVFAAAFSFLNGRAHILWKFIITIINTNYAITF